MPPIRIAFVVEATTGGVARHVIDLVTRLNREEFQPILYLSFQRPDSWREAFRALRDQGVLLREISMGTVPNWSAVQLIASWAGRDAVDILHLHSARAGYLGRQAAALLETPVIYTPHAFPFQRTTDWLRPLYRMVERRLAARTTAIVCVSEGEREEALAAGLPEDNLVVIPNGIDVTQWPLPRAYQRYKARQAFGVAENEVVVGTMTRLTPQKGIDLLLHAWEELPPGMPTRARLLIWGDGPQRIKLERLVARLRLKSVSFLGATDNPWEAYAAMDIFCAPSRWEGGPYAVLEAMACGLPVLASAIAGHVDYVEDEVTGRLISNEFPGPLAAALNNLLIDEDLRALCGEAGRRHVEEHFTLTPMVRKTEELYRQVHAHSLRM
ncbi:MAG: glycosyltransferase family 4 protein [Armatimonadota bacterium]